MTLSKKTKSELISEVQKLQKQVELLQKKVINPIKKTSKGPPVSISLEDSSSEKQLLKEQTRAQLAEEINKKLQQEISERKKTERILEGAQKFTRLLIDSSLDMICASDREGLIIEFNVAAQKTFGYKPEEVIGKHVSVLYANPNERRRITDDEIYTKGSFSGEVVNKKNRANYLLPSYRHLL